MTEQDARDIAACCATTAPVASAGQERGERPGRGGEAAWLPTARIASGYSA
jgi:hypothetical protein